MTTVDIDFDVLDGNQRKHTLSRTGKCVYRLDVTNRISTSTWLHLMFSVKIQRENIKDPESTHRMRDLDLN